MTRYTTTNLTTMKSFRSLLTIGAYEIAFHCYNAVLDSQRVSVSEHYIPLSDSVCAVCQCPESLLSLLRDGLKPSQEMRQPGWRWRHVENRALQIQER